MSSSLSSAVLLLLALVLPARAADAVQEPGAARSSQPPLAVHAREWTLRAWALEPAQHREAIADALLSADWEERLLALEALQRAARIGRAIAAPSNNAAGWQDPAGPECRNWLEERIMFLARDPQPNVRATALALLPFAICHESREAARDLCLQALTAERFPAARRNALRSIAHWRSVSHLLATVGAAEQRMPDWVNLIRDPDAELAALALRTHLSAGPGHSSPEAQREILRTWLNGGRVSAMAALLGAFPTLLAAEHDPELLAALRAISSASGAGQRALVELLALRMDMPHDVQRLLAGWSAQALDPSDRSRWSGTWESALRAGAREASPALARGLLRAALHAQELSRQLAPRTPESEFGPRALGASWRAGVPGALLAVWDEVAHSVRVAAQPQPALSADELETQLQQLQDQAAFLTECAALSSTAALSTEELLAWCAACNPPSARRLWVSAGARMAQAPLDRLRPWLDPARDPDLREEVVHQILTAWSAESGSAPSARAGDESLTALIEPLLRDADPRIAQVVFRAWVQTPGTDFAPLHAAWSALPTDERFSRLRLMSRRARPTEFRDDLLALLDQSSTRSSSVIELASLFRGDAAIAAALRGALREELEPLTKALTLAQFRPHERSARELLRAIQRILAADAVGLMAEVLGASIHCAPELQEGQRWSPELPKTCAGLLGTSAPGRVHLRAWLGPAAPSRVRIEAALALRADEAASDLAPRVFALLQEDYAACDGELRIRILRALGKSTGAGDPYGVGEFLDGRARDTLEPPDQRIAALDALRSRADVARLARLLDDLREVDPRQVAAEYLGSVPGPDAKAALSRALRTRFDDAFRRRAPDDDDPEQLLVGSLLGAYAVHGQLPPVWLGECLRRPMMRAASDLERRFKGQGGPSVAFLWSAELQLAKVQARRGTLLGALRIVDGWSRLDGRLLLALAEVALSGSHQARDAHAARTSRTAARLLNEAACVALDGEAAMHDSGASYIVIALRLARVAQELQDWSACGHWNRALLDVLQLGSQLPGGGQQTMLERELGLYSRADGSDPGAFLRAGALQAHSRAAAAHGAQAQAATWLAAAAARVRHSLLAKESLASVKGAKRTREERENEE